MQFALGHVVFGRRRALHIDTCILKIDKKKMNTIVYQNTPKSSGTHSSPLHSLGFHYCKYEENSADLMIERNAEFTHYEFPVDVFWSDLFYT